MAKVSHAGARSTSQPEINRSENYLVHLGDTFTNASDATYHSLQYKFKPQSAGRSGEGSLQITQNMASALPFCSQNGHAQTRDGVVQKISAISAMQVSVHAPNVQDGNPGVSFEGQWAPSQQGLDCVAFFDGSSWRLELLSGMGTNIRCALTPSLAQRA